MYGHTMSEQLVHAVPLKGAVTTEEKLSTTTMVSFFDPCAKKLSVPTPPPLIPAI